MSEPDWVNAEPSVTVLFPKLPVFAISTVTFAGLEKALFEEKVCAAAPAKRNLESPVENVPAVLVKFPVTVITFVVPELMLLYVPLPDKLKLLTTIESKLAILALKVPVTDKVPPTVTVSAPLQPIYIVPVFTAKFPVIFTWLAPIVGSIT